MSADATATGVPPELASYLEKWIEEGRVDLPALPAVAGELLSMTFEPDCDLAKVESTLQRDPHLAGKVLATANSALFAPPTPIRTLRRAIAHVGIQRVRDVALRVSCESRVFLVKSFEREVKELLDHSMTTAMIGHAAARAAECDPDEAFLLGLLHDVGRPVLLQAIQDLKVVLRRKLKREFDVSPRAALDLTTPHHEQVGKAVLQNWGLPEAIPLAVSAHHDPSRIEHEPLARLVRVVQFADAVDRGDGDTVERAAAALRLPESLRDEIVERRDSLAEAARAL